MKAKLIFGYLNRLFNTNICNHPEINLKKFSCFVIKTDEAVNDCKIEKQKKENFQ